MLGLWLAMLTACVSESEFDASVQCRWDQARDWDDLYADPVDDIAALEPGTLVRAEHVVDLPAFVVGPLGNGASSRGAHVYRIAYVTELRGEHALGTARVAVPDGDIPDGGFDLVLHGHSTVGAADRCAPSKSRYALGFETPLQPLAARMVANGRLVVAPDYPGLGTPGPHAYMVKTDTGRDMLDAGRAAMSLCDTTRGVVRPPSGRVVLEGHSQGGHAVLAAHEAWERGWAPELELLGTVALNPAAELKLQIERLTRVSPAETPALLALNAYTQWYDDLGTLEDWLVEPWASDLQQGAEEECIARMTPYLDRPVEEWAREEVLEALEARDWPALAPLGDHLERNTPGSFQSEVPVLLRRGSDDWLIQEVVTDALRDRMCDCQVPVQYELLEGANHYSLPRRTADDTVAWIKDRFAGAPAFDDCPPGRPAQCVAESLDREPPRSPMGWVRP